jgi:hypothetical protein
MAHQITVALPDIHVPHEDRTALRAVHKYLAATELANLVILGDFMDMEEVSRYVAGRPRKIEGMRLKENAEHGKRILEAICKAARTANPRCKVYLLEGNHEFRIQDAIDAHPEFEGLLEIPGLLGLEALDVTWVPSWSDSEPLVIGDMAFVHGFYTTKYHAATHASALNHTVYYGHTHDVQEFSLPRLSGGPLVGKSLGCLCKLKQHWTKGRPNRWQQAFGVFYHNGSTHQELTIKIRDGKFIGPDGKEYKP